jgi:hypothetical protein
MSDQTEPSPDTQPQVGSIMRRFLTWIGIAIALVAMAACSTPGSSTDSSSDSATDAPASATVGEIQTYENLDPSHTTESVTYPQTPPVGGPHDPTWQNCGIYDEPVRNENAVHSLEHGAVWITYRPDLPAEDIASLQELVGERQFVLLSPYPDLPAPVVATAWGVQLPLDGVDAERLEEFITEYVQGAQSPEPGAPCVGGVGTPS